MVTDKKPKVEDGDTKNRTFQLTDFPADLLQQINATAAYLHMERLDFVVQIFREVMEDLEVEQLQGELKQRWEHRQERRKKRGDDSGRR